MAKHLNNRELAAFRRDVSALKKAGVVKPSLKVRSALPSTLSNGKTLRELAKQFKAATPSGGNTAKIVKIERDKAREYKKLEAYTVASTRVKKGKSVPVMVPAARGAKVGIDKDGNIEVTAVNGIKTVHLPIQYHNFPQYLRDVYADGKTINRMKHNNESFGFQIGGNNSLQAFSDIESLMGYLTGYESVMPFLSGKDARQAREFINALVIVKGPQPDMFRFVGGKERKERKQERTRQRRALRRGIRVNKSKAETRANWPQWKIDQYKAKRRAEEKKRRDKKKG